MVACAVAADGNRCLCFILRGRRSRSRSRRQLYSVFHILDLAAKYCFLCVVSLCSTFCVMNSLYQHHCPRQRYAHTVHPKQQHHRMKEEIKIERFEWFDFDIVFMFWKMLWSTVDCRSIRTSWFACSLLISFVSILNCDKQPIPHTHCVQTGGRLSVRVDVFRWIYQFIIVLVRLRGGDQRRHRDLWKWWVIIPILSRINDSMGFLSGQNDRFGSATN